MTKTTNLRPKTSKTAATDTGDIADPKAFETSLAELEAIVDRLEQGELSLEEALAAFERGIGLTRACQQALDRAEQRVRILSDGASDDPTEIAPRSKPIPEPASEPQSKPALEPAPATGLGVEPRSETRPRTPRKRRRPQAEPSADEGFDADSELPF